MKIIKEQALTDFLEEWRGVANRLAYYLTQDEVDELEYQWSDEAIEEDELLNKLDDFQEVLEAINYTPEDLVKCFEAERVRPEARPYDLEEGITR